MKSSSMRLTSVNRTVSSVLFYRHLETPISI